MPVITGTGLWIARRISCWRPAIRFIRRFIMSAFNRILVPTDLSEFASLAVKYGAHFSRKFASTLALLFVEDLSFPIETMEMPLGYYLENAPKSRLDYMTKLGEQARTLAAGIRVETMVTTDMPWQGIVQTAKTLTRDLLILGP